MTQQFIVPNGQYTFNPATKQITLPGITPLQLEGIQLVTNLTSGTLIYQFNNSALGGNVSGQTLTLAFNTSAMNATDTLQILYNPPSGGFFDRAMWLLQSICDYLRAPPWLMQFALGPKLAVVTDINSNMNLINTVSQVTSVSTVANQTNMGGINAYELPFALWAEIYNNGVRRNITTS